MQQGLFNIKENVKIANDVYKMTLEGDTSAITASGQFINIKLDGLFLRRPISVYDYDSEKVVIIYKVVGKGTDLLSGMKEGTLDVLTGLGNGYTISDESKDVLLLGGGVGVPPLYNLAKKLIEKGKNVT
ncbi:MAG: dihydroorotate dehydrogenase electron transfer subunit, partial [Clostridia bacterium]|nr:dihydroorotate dehydrogenase electron transfer subunit [Clostridia bacterium]